MRAVLASHVQHIVAAAQDLVDERDAGRAFFGLLSILAKEFLVNGNLHVSMARAGLVPEPTAERAEFERMLQGLLARAQRAKAVRRDVTAPDVIMLVRGALFPSDVENIPIEQRRRMFDVVCAGLRASAKKKAGARKPPIQ